jgi:hypothetical protein
VQGRHVEHGVWCKVRYRLEIGHAPNVSGDNAQSAGRPAAVEMSARAEAEIVHDQDIPSRVQQRIHQVRSDETGSAGYEYALHRIGVL